MARLERWRRGRRASSPTLQSLSFGAYNNAFKPARTDFDWLSKDPAEVDKYVNDPLCGFAVTTQTWVELLDALAEMHSPGRLSQIPKSLPIYVFAGDKDPVGHQGRGVRKLVDLFKAAGIGRVDLKLYPNGRHEMLNEINREEVVQDLQTWLADVITPKPA